MASKARMGVASASGALGGGGLDAETLGRAIAMGAEFVGADGGTVDAGPYHLGSGTCAYSRDSLVHEVDQLLATVPHPAGDPADADLHGGRQHAPLMSIEVP